MNADDAPAGPNPDAHVDTHLDNRGLEPPLPMVRTLEAYEGLPPGGRMTIHNDRVPVHLLPQLEARGARYRVEARPGGDALVTIERPTDAAP